MPIGTIVRVTEPALDNGIPGRIVGHTYIGGGGKVNLCYRVELSDSNIYVVFAEYCHAAS